MPLPLYDAHIHLTDLRLKKDFTVIISSYNDIGLDKAIVVGTSPRDWAAVVSLSNQAPPLIPAIGLHPWKVGDAPEDWQKKFLEFLDQGVRVIGEIGLDQWIDGHDIEEQQDAFRWQLSIATGRDLPTTIHCLKAHEPLLQTLREVDLPKCGFKLHAYNGPVATIQPLLELGAYFSFNAGQLKPNAKRVLELIRLVPDDRLLVETDAPNFQLTDELKEFELSDPEICHPGNILTAYRAIAELRGVSMEYLAKTVAENFRRYFLS